jgi:hypothetical protein
MGCHVHKQGSTSRFGIQVQPAKKGNEISFGKGNLFAVAGSQAAPLLNALKVALEAKHVPSKVGHAQSLPFTLAILGTNQSRMKDGGFAVQPAGTWTAMKIFLPGHNDEDAEVFLNLSPSTRKGEFSIKDSDYGDDVLKDLAKIL